jgi:predicted kinase
VRCFVLVGGWPASGKTTLAHGLAAELQLPCLARRIRDAVS